MKEEEKKILSILERILLKPVPKHEFKERMIPKEFRKILRWKEFRDDYRTSRIHFYVKVEDLIKIGEKIDPMFDREKLFRLLWVFSDLNIVWVPKTDEISCKGTISGRLKEIF